MVTTTKDVKVSRARCRIGDNAFFLITEVYRNLVDNGFQKEADAMQKEIDRDANSPDDVLKICQKYVTLE